MLPVSEDRDREIARWRAGSIDPRRALQEPHAVAVRPGRPPSGAAGDARLRRAVVHRLRRNPRRSPLRRRPRHRHRHGALQGGAGHGGRPPEGQRHQAEDLPELRLRAPGRLPQGAAGDAARAQVRPSDHLLCRHAGRVSGHRIRGARRRRSDCAQPARDGDARGADHRDRARRRRQRGSAGHRRRRSHPDARVRDLQRDSARRLRRHSLARLQSQGGRGRGAEDHGGRPVAPRDHRRDRQRAGRRRPHQPQPGGSAARCGACTAR